MHWSYWICCGERFLLWNLQLNSEQNCHMIAEEQRMLLTTNIAMNQPLVRAVPDAIGALCWYKNPHWKSYLKKCYYTYLEYLNGFLALTPNLFFLKMKHQFIVLSAKGHKLQSKRLTWWRTEEKERGPKTKGIFIWIVICPVFVS